MDDDDFAWVRRTDEVLDPDHPDWAEWDEADRIMRWVESGSPVPDEEPPTTMASSPRAVEVPEVALAVTRKQAAKLLNVSDDTFERHVWAELRVVPVGSRHLVPVDELQKWMNDKAARALR